MRNWNDIIVIIYGVAGLGVLWFFRSVLLSSPRFALLFAAAFVCYSIHTVIDSIVITQNAMKVVPEETFKVMSGYCLFLAMASKLLDTLRDVLAGNWGHRT